MKAFQKVFAEEGLSLSREEYYTRYLGLPDRDIAKDTLRRKGRGAEVDVIDHLLARKAMAYREMVRRDLPEVPGAASFILEAASHYPVAVASGAIRVEVEDGLYRLGVRDAVSAVVTIEDVTRGKPDPEIFFTARAALICVASSPGARIPLSPSEPAASFLVIEDSPAGLAAARAAWMPAVGVATSCAPSDLRPATLVVPDLASLSLDTISRI